MNPFWMKVASLGTVRDGAPSGDWRLCSADSMCDMLSSHNDPTEYF